MRGIDAVMGRLDEAARDELAALYRDLHQHPEPAFEEKRTAGIAADRLREAGFEVRTGIGGTGVAGVLRNGEGPTVALRADMDALPVLERTGLPYASANDGLMHACGHDMHVTCLRLYGRGGHSSQPEHTVDPVVLAAAIVMRLQTVVSREVSPFERAVLTVAQIHAGHKENVIADEASITLNIRTFSPEVRRTLLAAIERVVNAEAVASGAPRPPSFHTLNAFPLTANDPGATADLTGAFTARFGAARLADLAPMMGSEDFGVFGTAAGVPSVFWGLGGSDPSQYARAEREGRLGEDVPGNHSPFFAPLISPTLPMGIEALVTAALTWLAPATL